MSDEERAVAGLEALHAGMAAGELLWIIAGLVYFAPAGIDPFGRALVEAAAFLERVGFKPSGDEIRERWLR